MDPKLLYQVAITMAGAVAGLMIGNAGELAKAREPLTPLKFAMRFVDGGKQKTLMGLNRVRLHSDRMKWCVDQLFDHTCMLAALKTKVAKLPVSLKWGVVAQEMHTTIQQMAAEIDRTLYLQRIRGFFEIRAALQEVAAYAKEITWNVRDAGFKAFMKALDERQQGQRIPPVRVVSTKA